MIKKRITLIFSLVGLVLVVTIGTSFAYLRATRTQTDKNKISTASCLQIDFVGENVINMPTAYPIRDEVGLSQTPYKFTISNVCSQNIEVSLGFESLPGSTLPLNYVKGIMAKEGHLADTTIAFLNSYPNSTPQNNGTARLMLTDSIPGLSSKTYEYTMWIDYNVTASDISPNDVLNGKIIATYTMKTNSVFTKYCYTSDYTPGGTIADGTTYTLGAYTYKFNYEKGESSWDSNTGMDGWGAALTDATSTSQITDEVCTYINDKPLVSASYMYAGSQATAIDLSKFNTSLIKNMDRMFSYTKAEELDISNFDTANVEDSGGMFLSAEAATILLPEVFDLRKSTDLSHMFDRTSNVVSLDLTGLMTEDALTAEHMFAHTNATVIDLPEHWDLKKATELQLLFFDTANIREIDLSGLETRDVTQLQFAFQECKATSITFPEYLDLRKVTTMQNMFFKSGVTSLDLRGFHTRDLENIRLMFQLSPNLSSILFSDKFDTSNVTDMQNVFAETNLSSLDISYFDTSNVTNMGWMFMKNPSLSVIYVSELWSTAKVTVETNMFLETPKLRNFNSGRVGVAQANYSSTGYLTYLHHPDNNGNCYTEDYVPNGSMSAGKAFTNGQYTYKYKQEFSENSGWGNITGDGWGVALTDSVNNAGASTAAVDTPFCKYINGKPTISAQAAFVKSKASSIDLSTWDTSNITNMAYMFRKNTTTSLDITPLNTAKVTNMEMMFSRSEATSLDFSGFDTSRVTNMHAMFSYIKQINLDLSSFDTSNVTGMESMFYATFAIELDLSSFDTSKVTNMNAMFSESAYLSTIYVSDLWDTSNVTTSDYMFSGATHVPNFSSNYLDKTRAHYNTNGYLTYKAHS